MGRKRKEIDPEDIRKLKARGMTQVEMAKELGVSHPTLAKRMGELRTKEGLLREYRSVQGLELTALQARSLDVITPEKIEKASLVDLARAFKVLKDCELKMEGKPKKITGLVAYLLEIERIEKEEGNLPPVDSKISGGANHEADDLGETALNENESERKTE